MDPMGVHQKWKAQNSEGDLRLLYFLLDLTKYPSESSISHLHSQSARDHDVLDVSLQSRVKSLRRVMLEKSGWMAFGMTNALKLCRKHVYMEPS